ncbi:6-phosphogluconolactonase [Arenimonas daejeonensis]|uniref:6-phosphogluconolactonase n=1 Tax=Arenimonas daejeonensis TaxID=370777 RepID=UPI0011BE9805|nr:6-phosphogluconolactonase [Arenimonas daejeonensis]
MPWRLHEHADGNALAAACVDILRETAGTALRERGQAQLALAGGRTPLPAYRRWAEGMPADTRIAIAPTDERWVAADHPHNNLSQLQACFAGETQPRWLPLVPERPGAEPDLAQARRSLSTLGGGWDLVLLGMGEDGHFASLFPGDPGLAAALDPDAAADAVIGRPDPLPPEAPHPRISLNLANLLHSRRLLLVVSGARKHELLARVQPHPDPSRWPVSALLHSRATVEIHWSP